MQIYVSQYESYIISSLPFFHFTRIRKIISIIHLNFQNDQNFCKPDITQKT